MQAAKQRRVGLFISNLTDTYEARLIEEIGYFCQRSNIDLVVFYGGGMDGHFTGRVDENPLFTNMDPKSFDAFIISAGPLSNILGKERVEQFFGAFYPTPIISIGNALNEIPSILPDNAQGMYDMVKHVIETHGARNIGFISGPKTNTEAQERLEGFKRALEDSDIEFSDDLVKQGGFFKEGGARAMASFIEEGAEVDVVVCANDESAWGALEELERNNILVPSQILVTGFDDMDFSRFGHPPLTTVKQPIGDIAWTAINIIENIWQGQEVQKVTRVATRLIIRRSCSCNTLNSELKRLPYPVEVDRLPPGLADKIDLLHETTTRFIFKSGLLSEVTEAIEGFFSIFQLSRIDDGIMISHDLLESVIRQLARNPNPDALLKVSKVHNLLETIALETEARLIARERFEGIRTLNDSQFLAFQLVKCRTVADLAKVLEVNLPRLGIHSFVIIIYGKDDIEGRVLFAFDEMGRFSLSKGEKVDTARVIPAEVSATPYSAYVLPMLADETLRGYCILEYSELEAVNYFNLYNTIAGAIKSSSYLSQLEAHTEELKAEVARATAELTKANGNLRELSLKDTLTGLRNRRYVQEVVLPDSLQVQQAFDFIKKNPEQREKKTHFGGLALFLIDLDHFKHINDTYGHGVGDEVLRHLASIFQRAVRKNDVVIRWGGEEFLLILRDFKEEHVLEIGEKIRARVETYPFTVAGGRTLACTCSIGCVFFPMHGDLSAEKRQGHLFEAVEIADKALYYAKEHKRNQAVMVRLVPDKSNQLDVIVSQDLSKSETQGLVLIDRSAGREID